MKKSFSIIALVLFVSIVACDPPKGKTESTTVDSTTTTTDTIVTDTVE